MSAYDEVSLVERLRSVDIGYVAQINLRASDGTATGPWYVEIGILMHDAADEIETLTRGIEHAI